MRNFKLFLLMSFLFVGNIANAQVLNKIYSGEQLPADEGWQELKLDGTVNTVAGTVSQQVTDGVLKLRSTNEANQFTQLGWYKTGVGLDISTGYTIEIKAKVINASNYGAFTLQGYDKSGKGFRLGIYDAFLAELNNPFAATNVLQSGLDNAAAFHTYRLAVQPTGLVTVYRDAETVGTFPLSVFYFDNIIENGGFEDGDNPDNAAFFPDFLTNGFMYRSDYKADHFGHVNTGDWGLLMDNDNKPGDNGYTGPTDERARTREIAMKPDTKYNISIKRNRATDEPWAWRDMGGFWNTQQGTLNGDDDRDNHAFWAGANDDWWQTHNQQITTPAEGVESFRFEFPSWKRDGFATSIQTAFDDFYFSEELGLKVGPQVAIKEIYTPLFPATYTNLIANGDFENVELNNDNTPYTWTLSEGNDSNEPVGYNPVWGGDVRLQVNDKPDDQVGGQWAHSGTSSVRFSTLGNKGNNFNFSKELQPNKTYRFNFWIRPPHWPDYGWLKVNVGSELIWQRNVGGNQNAWANIDLTFTTTADNTSLSLYTTSDDHGDWWNIFFDDFVLYEVTSPEPDPLAGKTNLLANGDFENITLGNDGEAYEWALASAYQEGVDFSDNYPVAWSDLWGTYVRLQDVQKGDDTGEQWAHSGTKSLRFSYLGDGKEQTNMDFRYDLEANKTYTLVFWFKTANYPDRGNVFVGNGDLKVWGGNTGTESIEWSRKVITFTTNTLNHELRIFTEIGGWFNFYIDDIFLYEEETVVPLVADSYLFFGKSTGTRAADVEIEYVAIDTTGAYAPGEVSIKNIATTAAKNLAVSSVNGTLTFKVTNPASVNIYTAAGTLVSRLNVSAQGSVVLPQGVYIVKSVSQNGVETAKVINK
jgi:hypothetical protein